MLKIGDVVKIREDLNDGMKYVNSDMVDYAGKETIILVSHMYGGVPTFELSIDKQQWQWTVDMFDLITSTVQQPQTEETEWRNCYNNYQEAEYKRFGITDRYYNPDGKWLICLQWKLLNTKSKD